MTRVVPLSALDTLLGVDANVTTQRCNYVVDSRLNVDKIRRLATARAKKWLTMWAGYSATPTRVELEMNESPVGSKLTLFFIYTSKIELILPPPEVAELKVLVQVRNSLLKHFRPIKLYNLACRILGKREVGTRNTTLIHRDSQCEFRSASRH